MFEDIIDVRYSRILFNFDALRFESEEEQMLQKTIFFVLDNKITSQMADLFDRLYLVDFPVRLLPDKEKNNLWFEATRALDIYWQFAITFPLILANWKLAKNFHTLETKLRIKQALDLAKSTFKFIKEYEKLEVPQMGDDEKKVEDYLEKIIKLPNELTKNLVPIIQLFDDEYTDLYINGVPKEKNQNGM